MGGSNPRPHDYESGALPAELIQHTCPEGHVILPQVAGFVNSFLGRRCLPRSGIEARAAAAVDFHGLVLDFVNMSASRARNFADAFSRAAPSAADVIQFLIADLFYDFAHCLSLL